MIQTKDATLVVKEDTSLETVVTQNMDIKDHPGELCCLNIFIPRMYNLFVLK